MKTGRELACEDARHDCRESNNEVRVDSIRDAGPKLNCLYKISGLIRDKSLSSNEVLAEVVKFIPGGWQYPEITCARIGFADDVFETENFRETQWRLSSEIFTQGEDEGTIDVYYLEEKPEADNGPFLEREKKLLQVIANQVGGVIEHDKTKRDLKSQLVFFQKLINTVPNPIYFKDMEGRYQGFNIAFELFTGIPRRELLGKTISDVTTKEIAEVNLKVDAEVLRAGGTRTVEAHLKFPDGRESTSIISKSAYLDDAGRPAGIVGVVIDVTDQRKSEQALMEANKRLEEMNRQLKDNQNRLVQSEKMAAIGQLAAGVAHEINNPVGFVKSNLSTLTGYVDTFKDLLHQYELLTEAVRNNDTSGQAASLDIVKRIREDEDLDYILKDVGELLSESVEGTERVRDIVQNLKSFARLDESRAREADINDCIEATLKIVWNELKYKCTVNKNLKPLPLIRCYPGQLNQVFMNLLVNASQAIPEKGEITIETDSTDEEVIIRISDTGNGIPPEERERIFEPFYTTKPTGKGTGLGLAISIDIIHKHNGSIDMESEVGVGTTFTIRLPVEGVTDEREGDSMRGR